MVDESSTIPAVVMPYATTATTTKASSTLRATSYEDTSAPRSNSVPAPTASGSAAAGAAGPDTRSHSVSAVSSSPGVVNAARPATSSSQRNKSSVTGLRNAEQSSKDKERSGLSVRNIPSIIVNDAAGFRPSSRPGSRPGSRWSERKWAAGLRTKKSAEFEGQQSSSSAQQAAPQSSQPDPETPFNGISLDIPTGGLDELGPQSMRFSKRGSLIKDVEKAKLEMNAVSEQQEQEQEQEQQEKENEEEKRQGVEEPQGLQDQSQQPDQSEPQGQEASPVPTTSTDQNDPQQQPPQIYGAPPRRLKPSGSLRVRQVAIPSRAISADEDMLSRRVRLMYEKGEENVSDTEVAESLAAENGVLWEESPGAADTPDTGSSSTTKRVSAIMPDQRNATPKKESNELAGGVEYWQNIRAGDVDRYGFIRPKTDHNGDGSNPIQRVSTSLLLASETPRRKHSIRPSSGVASNRSFTGRSPTRKLSESSMRPTSSQSTYSATVRRSGSRFRQATNHLPHNRNRRVTDEAADMLTLPIEAVDSANGIDSATARSMKKKEWEREDKWTKMARPTKRSKDGGGMTFEFDIQSSKLIERTWKGIPDRWRSTAWYSFLEASAKKRSDSPTESQLIEAYHEYQYVSSPDDVQIDIDVPRTITSHIMFRRRYRGGQRLLFRVLHAMSLYFPDTGYVQGMAALAATLLAYFDEEHAFIMLVRLWQLRGLERLYECGFAGLMGALDDFEKEWLAGGEVATKLIELGIPPTAYGTRWYLTLFNYSIPFPAQLRVWDVFMLLGDTDLTPSPSILPRPSSKPPHNQQGTQDAAAGSGFGKGLDVLHATSAALIDGMRDIILESDFENAMKVLTSWVPIKDVELFMRVARAEWKVHHRKRVL